MSTMNQIGVTLSGQSGTGAFAGTVSPTFTTPVLGTPASGDLANCTDLPVAGGGTGAASFTAYAVLCGGTTSTGALQSLASLGTTGQVLTSNGASALPSFQTVNSGALAVVSVAGTSQAAAVNTLYYTQNSATVTITLPATAALGAEIDISQAGTGLVAITANSGQTIVYLSASSSSGGSFTTAAQYDYVQLRCIVANTTWQIYNAASLGLTPA